jgi:two-component system sensor histidine kinase YesM
VGEELYLVNADGTVLLGAVPPGTEPGRSGRAAAGPAVLEDLPPDGGGPVFRLQGRQRVMVSSIPLPFASWRLVSIIGTERITRPFDLALAAARGSIAAFLLLFVVFIALFFREIVRPVHQVVATMRQVAGGDYSVAVGETGLAELAELGRTFNAMVAQVRRLTREKEQKERERSRLELAALRLKLNPHFLTNTLNSIRLMAVMSRADNIKEMTGALMKVLNDSFRDEGGTATVAAELEVLESYTHIMKVRYGDRFDVLYQVAPPARPLYILRMLLQPLVENAILHGVSDLPRKGEILVRGDTEDGRLYLEVADNGRGMAREQIEDALAGERPEHHGLSRVGLHSVRSRILLAYGEPYGLRIASEPGAGTRITLCLPVLPNREAAGAMDGDVPRELSSAAERRCRRAGAAEG